jgi:aspartyl-tRNA(Asn)/glutamyl-tRNA(Gln) amidotransferase subunit C
MRKKMSLSHADAEKVAHLARLPNEADKYVNELSKILDLVAQMNAIDTSAVTPMAHPLNQNQPLREDVVTASNQRDLLLGIAPQTEAGLFIVPKVIE